MALVTKKPQKLNVFEAIFFDVAFNKDVTQFAMQICVMPYFSFTFIFFTFLIPVSKFIPTPF